MNENKLFYELIDLYELTNLYNNTMNGTLENDYFYNLYKITSSIIYYKSKLHSILNTVEEEQEEINKDLENIIKLKLINMDLKHKLIQEIEKLKEIQEVQENE